MIKTSKKPFSVLIIEDSEDDFEIYSDILRKTYPICAIEHCETAEEATEKLRTQKYDIILLDYKLPTMDGIEFLWGLNLMQIEVSCPIIAVTGSGDERLVLDFIRLGVSEYIPKDDISVQTLARSINNSLKSFYTRKIELDRQEELSRFACTISHDLKSPLNRILSYSRLLEKKLGKEEISLLKNILEDTEYMIEFTDELLHFAEFGPTSIEKVTINLKQVLDKSIRNLEVEIQNTGAEIKIEGKLPKVQGNMLGLVRLFQNLISNSMKYCKDTPIIKIKSEVSLNGIIVRIIDNGIGIQMEDEPDLFRPLVRGKYTLEKSGTGLGLALCKSIANIHQADIRIHPGKESGTEIELIFPYILQDNS